MKKLPVVALCLAVLLLFPLVGCAATPADPVTDSATTTTTTATTTTTNSPSAETAAPLTMTVVQEVPSAATLYTDPTVDTSNYTLQFAAGEDLTNLRIMTIDDGTYLFDRTLYTLPTLAKGESVYVRTYVNDTTPIRGIAVTDAQGETHYFRPTYSGKDGTITLKEQESIVLDPDSSQFADIQEYLNKVENNGFVQCCYETPEQASLYAIFYDGAGVGEWGSAHWDDAEKAAVLAACGWDEFHVPVLKIKATDMERVLRVKLGVEYAQMKKTMEESGFNYVKAYDAYYDMHSDSNHLSVTVTAVTLNPEGFYVVEYNRPTFDSHEHLAVTLRAHKEAGYQFASNIQVDTE